GEPAPEAAAPTATFTPPAITATAVSSTPAGTSTPLIGTSVTPAGAAASPTGSATTLTATTAPSGSSRPSPIHVVASGDTLCGIARQYQIAPDALAAANGFPDPSTLRVGQQLTIPAQAGTSAAPTATPRP